MTSGDALSAEVDTPTPAPAARLYGEPVSSFPDDLYIPPEALRVFLEAFEGPLDLLLYLIRKQNFNILDIPMAELTRQYLSYVDQVKQRQLELAAEYLLMAAMLIEIKSRMLLPVRHSPEDEEVDDPRAELVRRLLEYEQIKSGAAQLAAWPQQGRDFWTPSVAMPEPTPRLPDVHPDELRQAWRDILKRARLVQHHRISRETLSVREYMGVLLRRLNGRRFLEFQDLFDGPVDAPLVVVTFVAMLELARESLLELTQAEAYAPLYLRLSYTPSPA